MQFDSDFGELTILAGTIIYGGLTFDFTKNSIVNFGPGLNASFIFDGVPDTINAAGRPFCTFPNEVVTIFDLTGFAAVPNALNDMTGAIASALEERMYGRRGRQGSQTFSMAGANGNYRIQDNGGWATLTGGYRNQDATSTTSAYDNLLGGIIGGFDRENSENVSSGFFGGYSYGRVRSSGGVAKTETQSIFGGGYASYSGDTLLVDFSTTIGATINQNDRLGTNNTVIGGVVTNSADYNVWFVSPSLTIGPAKPVFANVTPSVRLRYSALFLNGYTETETGSALAGTQSALTVGDRTVQVGEIRGQLAYQMEQRKSPNGVLDARLRVGVDGIFN
ncbi:MAG: autotransporter outer membrane beta-barrel domain-containing protein [Hyphomicrobiales bacterium]|nr:autotransporter outer membrane beta-barrel domain-containing protein [Hyphomicrobiales bacterium]MCP5000106.1 autotransporter outer membrane beta-barrel domain-containing protein [Hyphomicrobiales bacterium]